MGLESATYIGNLVATNPVATDKKNQGDDHLRLLKSVLQSTFPNADHPFYQPKTGTTLTADTTLTQADGGSIIAANPVAGNFTITVPAGLPDGWAISVYKSGVDANAAFVTPASGTLVDGNAKARVTTRFDLHRFIIIGGTLFHLDPFGYTTTGVVYWTAGGIPPGWMAANGASLLRADFPKLFGVYSTLYGAADGTHFNLPNLQDRFIVGAGSSYGLGGTGGENFHQLTIGEMPNHDHGAATGQAGAHSHTYNGGATNRVADNSPGSDKGYGAGGFGTVPSTYTAISIDGVGHHTHGIASQGGSSTHENRPPYQALYPMIRGC